MADESTPPQDTPIEPVDESSADDLPANDVQVEDAGTLKKKVTVKIPSERIDAKRSELFGELQGSAQVPGFRVGHAPRRLIEKRFSKEISDDVRNSLIGESLSSALDDSELKTLGEPDLDLDAIELPETGPLEFSFEVEVAPEFELPELKGIPVEKPSAEVDDERIDEQLEEIRRSRGHYEAVEEPVQSGDMVVGSAKISGEDIETLERTGLQLRAAPGQVEGIPLVDLGEKLEGAKPGDTVTLETEVGDAHPNEDWRGKTLTIEITVSQVRRQVLPELNDEFAEQLGFDSVDELRDFARQRMESQVQREAEKAQRDQVCDYLLENTDFELPEGVTARHTHRILQRRYVSMLQMGMPREKIDESMAELQAAAGEQAQRDLRLQFILGKIIEQEGLDATEAELNERIAQMAAYHGRRPERLRQELAADGSLEQIYSAIREDKALDMLLDQAEITEASGETDDQNDQDESK
jgi:trigger factor